MKDYYKVLDISSTAKPEKIRKQYRLLVVACHPDKFTDPKEKSRAEEKIKEINEAYEVLMDPEKRARYDRRRSSSSPHPSPPRNQSRAGPSYTRVDSYKSPDHLHYEFHGLRGDRLEVNLDRKANVVLVDENNYRRYQLGQPFNYVGGFAHVSPIRLSVPYSGIWHLVIDTGGYSGRVRATARIHRYW